MFLSVAMKISSNTAMVPAATAAVNRAPAIAMVLFALLEAQPVAVQVFVPVRTYSTSKETPLATPDVAVHKPSFTAPIRPRVCGRPGEFLNPSSPPPPPPRAAQPGPPPQRWSFPDMVNKHQNHVDVIGDDEGEDANADEEVSVDLSSLVPEVRIAPRFFERISKD
ncbi:GRAS family transcription factor [Striga asiatica]|uniref:GRAS family transcription factor n=1 Tax=Striga asiatica TaxID=4170 RepID=A0A5A7QBG0_STRAF|nr:GRAS family transcription factor [Striga asiatica]